MERRVIRRDTAAYPRSIAVLEIDCDPNAERFVIAERSSMKVLMSGPLPPSKVVKVILPNSYAVGEKLVALIFDEQKQYSAAVLDGISCEFIAVPVDMSQ